MRRLAALLVVSALVIAATARAQEAEPTKPPPPAELSPEAKLPAPEFVLTADVVTYDSERDLYEATGDVKVTQADGRVLTSDWLLFNGTTRTGVASGDVVIVDAQNTVRAQFVAVDLRSTVTVAMRGSMDNPVPGFLVHGEVIERTGVDTFQIENGTFTTCRCPPETERRPWELETKDASVEVGGYAVAHDVWFKAFGFPVAYSPWLLYPMKTERQTGFLIPSLSQSSRNGTEIEAPFFWAVTDNVNLLLAPMWISRRGLLAQATTEYVAGTATEGHGGAAILPSDRVVQNSDTAFFSDNRWAYWLRHQQPIEPGVEFGIDLNEISDNDVVFDFPKLLGRDTQHQRMVESAAWLGAARDGLYGSALLSVNNDLQSPNDLDRDGFFLQRLPDLRGSTLQRGLFGTPFMGAFTSRFTNFVQFSPYRHYLGQAPVHGQFFDFGSDARPDIGEPMANGQFPSDPNVPIPDSNKDDAHPPPGSVSVTTTEGDGIFEEGEPLADSGQRLDFFPKLSLPYQLGIFEMLAEGGLRETLYFANQEDKSVPRTLYTVRADVRTLFGRQFALGTLPLSHVIEPRIAFAGVFAPDQTGNPLFIPEPARLEPRLIDGDIRLVTDDPSDRVPDARLLQLQVSNRLYGPGRLEGEPARLYGELRIGSGYDGIAQAFTRVFAMLDFHPASEFDVSLDGGWDPEAKHLEDLSTAVGWHSEAGDQIRVSYRFNRNTNAVFEGFLGRGKEFDAGNTPTEKINQINLTSYFVATNYLELFAEGFKSLEKSGADGGRIGTLLISTCKCWELLMDVEKVARTKETRFNFQFRLSGLGEGTQLENRRRRAQQDLYD
jgi:lipopolysaccharide assembly outer membrane protein LptD (OstA)